MADQIQKNASLSPSQDYESLRIKGIEQIQQLAADSWTDHNAHDPGITMLEAMAYALTDVGNRIQQPIADLLSSGAALEGQFPKPTAVLPVNPWTVDDLRKQLIDLPQVRNAWIQQVKEVEPPLFFLPVQANPSLPPEPPFHQLSPPGEPIQLHGLFEVLLEFETPGTLQEEDIVVDINASVIRRENLAFSFLDEDGITQHDTLIVEFTFPYWDEDHVKSWANRLNISSLDDPDGGPSLVLQTLPAELAGNDYLLRAAISHDAGGPDEIGVLVKVFTELESTGPRRTAAEAILLAALEDVGLWERYNEMVMAAHASLDSARTSCEAHRNLCESMYRYRAVRIQEIAINANMRILAGTDVEDLLGQVFWRISQFLDRPPVFGPFSEQLDKGISGEVLLEGPLLESGWLDTNLLIQNDQHQSRSALYVSDFGALLLEPVGDDLDKIESITGLSLSNYLRNRLVTTGARDCLRLINPGVYQPRFSITKSNINVYRDGERLDVDIATIIDLVEQYRLEANLLVQFGQPDIPLPRGQQLDLLSYVPLGEDMPLTYGLSSAGLPATASTERHAKKNQLQAYLFPIEQMIADSLAQLGNLPAVFSPEGGDQASYFSQDIYQVPAARYILSGANSDPVSWLAYQQHLENTYRQTRQLAGETPAVQLERRHQMLDHLLARQGENMLSYSLQKLRRATEGMDNAAAAEARKAARVELRNEKAAFLAALPRLQSIRGLGMNLGLEQRAKVLATSLPDEPESPQRWQLYSRFGALLIQQATNAPNAMAAMLAGEQAIPCAGNRNFYHIVSAGSRFRLTLRNSTSPTGGELLAQTSRTYPNQAAAEEIAQLCINAMLGAWNNDNRSGTTQKLRYLLGFQEIERRSLSTDYRDYLSIRSAGGGFLRYDILDERGRAVFFSPNQFATEEEIFEDVHELIHIAKNPRSWRAVPEGNNFRFRLIDEDENTRLIRPATGPDEEATLAIGSQLSQFLNLTFSREGLHLVEHLLLRPQDSAAEAMLSLYDLETKPVMDPYSSRVTVVLPSGHTRDFGIPESEPVEDLAFAQGRDQEWRRYAEQAIRNTLPAHVFPHIVWLDRDSSNVPDLDAPSLNGFEDAWRSFLENTMRFEADPNDVISARERMRMMLTRIHLPAMVEALLEV